MKNASLSLSALFLISVTSHATVITLDFESQTAGSSTPPAGWQLIDTHSTSNATYATSGAGAGSNGAGGSAGLAGDVTSVDFPNGNHPGGYLVSNTTVDLSQALTGSFDFRIVHEGDFDDVGFLLGAVADGITGSSAGELLYVKLTEGGGGKLLVDGSATAIVSENAPIDDDTWYHATVSWTPTSGTTGNYSFTINNFSSDVVTLSTTGFTFDSADAQIGFGSVNDTIRFDNVNFTSVPEPASLSLLLLGLAGALTTRRRMA